MKASNIVKLLVSQITANRHNLTAGKPGHINYMVWGPPGVGKSAIVSQVAKALGLKLYDVRAAQLDPVDLRGIPTIKDGRTCFCPPDFFPRESDGECLLFLDELPQSPTAVQNSLLQLCRERRLGEYILPDKVHIIAAGNRLQDRAGATKITTALSDRFGHVEFDLDLNDWTQWAIQAGIKPEVVAFIRFRPNLLHDFDPKRDSLVFPTPRSWEYVSDMMNGDLPKEIEFEAFKGFIGEGGAAEFTAFLKIFRNLPNPDVVLMNPDTADVPKDMATVYALCGALAQRVTPANAGRFMRYANRLPAEYSVMMVNDGVKRNPTIHSCAEFTEWFMKHSDLMN